MDSNSNQKTMNVRLRYGPEKPMKNPDGFNPSLFVYILDNNFRLDESNRYFMILVIQSVRGIQVEHPRERTR